MLSKAIIDTNVVIYPITGDPNYANRAANAIRDYTQGEGTVFLPTLVIAEVIYVLEGAYFQYERSQAAAAVEKFILNSRIECPDQRSILYALQKHRTKGLDFLDGYCASLAIQNQLDLITDDLGISKHTEAPFRLI